MGLARRPLGDHSDFLEDRDYYSKAFMWLAVDFEKQLCEIARILYIYFRIFDVWLI